MNYMDLNVFIDLIRALIEEVKENNVSITLTIYPDYSELNIEPYQAIKMLRNNGSETEYVFKEDE